MAKHTPGRNDPCPCGSEKKYKHCHLGKDVEEIQATSRNRLVVLIAVFLSIAAGIAVGWTSGLETGFAVGGGALMLVGIILVIRKPPPPNKGAGDPAGLNFGR